MTELSFIAQRLFNSPLVLEESKCAMIIAALCDRVGVANLSRLDGRVESNADLNQKAAVGRSGSRSDRKPYQVIDGVAWITIEGTLVHKYGHVDPYSGMTGYDGIAAKLRDAMLDKQVHGIWLDINSPGGEVSGCFDLCDEIFASNKRNGGKPIWAMANETACSGAYAIGCSADKFHATRTSYVSSVGVFCAYVNWERAYDEAGLNVHLYRAGLRKNRFSGLEEPDEQADEKLMAEMAETRLLFAETVARNRKMALNAVLETEADVFKANAALEKGLIDGVASEIEAFGKFQRYLKRIAR